MMGNESSAVMCEIWGHIDDPAAGLRRLKRQSRWMELQDLSFVGFCRVFRASVNFAEDWIVICFHGGIFD